MRTVFVPVPDHPGEPGDNIIYAASFALAWDELSRILGGDPESVEPVIRRLNASSVQEGALQKGDYETNASVSDDEVRVSAFFAKSLPFAVPFSRKEGGMVFNKKMNVKAFGMPRYNEAQASQVQVMYYETDDRFVIRLTAGTNNDDIYLAKGYCDGVKLSVMRSRVNSAMEKGRAQMAKGTDSWKYAIGKEDEVFIPEVRFQLAATFRDMLHGTVMVRGQSLRILEAEQRTAFVLDEKGIILESEAVVGVDSTGVSPAAKRLYFDKPFLIMIQDKQAEHPYFIMKVANVELMVKETGK